MQCIEYDMSTQHSQTHCNQMLKHRALGPHLSSHGFACAVQVCRGTAVTMVSPTSGAEEIANPFLAAEEQQ